MKLAKTLLLGVFGLALQGTATAQIYESKDAEGVPEFSDTPTAGSEVVDLQKTNLADEPPDIPIAPPEENVRPAAAAAPSAVGEPVNEVYQGYNNNNNDNDNDERARDRVDHALPGDHRPVIQPHPVGGKPGVHKGPGPGGHAGGGRK